MNVAVTIGILANKAEKYISLAIESVLQQETSFNYKIIVLCDNISDDANSVLQHYREAYPEKISIAVAEDGKILLKFYELIDTEYFALLDGKDVWVGENSLQQLVDVLEQNPVLSMCSGQTYYFKDENITEPALTADQTGKAYFLQDILSKGFFCNKAGIVFRNVVFCKGVPVIFNSLPEFEECLYNDEDFLMLLHLEYGPIYVLPDVVALQRNTGNGIERLSIKRSIEASVKNYFYRQYFSNKYLQYQILLNSRFDYYYHEMWKRLINEKNLFPSNCLSVREEAVLHGLLASLSQEVADRKARYDSKGKYCNHILTTEKRYMAIGFDDFRDSDFSLVLPLLKKYGYRATFNRIAGNIKLSYKEKAQLDMVMGNGNELGDHTWFHCNYIYDDPLCNGQNPNALEGNQIPFPSNEELRTDFGNGKNAFGFSLSECVGNKMRDWNGRRWTEYNFSWGELTDEQCQLIRDAFSIYKDKSGMLARFDELSNIYIGTTGSSFGSWDAARGCYTQGIFTDSKTSANHEIWERVLYVTKRYYQELYGEDFSFVTWSWPGSIFSRFYFKKAGKIYYDRDCSKLYNYTAKFMSSRMKDENGEAVNRSWNQCLRQAGYKIAHDSKYPARKDGQSLPMMSKQFIFNASLSRQDAVLYPTNRTVSYTGMANAYPENFFADTKVSAATQMYDGGGEFYHFIEAIRHDTANGLVHGEVIDSVDSYSERVFMTQMLEYCKATGVEVITKADAYDLCFNQIIDSGNLIYNPFFRNTAKEFLPDANSVPSNPDGYQGDCSVLVLSDNQRCLKTTGSTYYLHFGIPYGFTKYSAEIMGQGVIRVCAIKNADDTLLRDEELQNLAEIQVDAADWKWYSVEFEVPENGELPYEQRCEGLGEKIMGLKIVYYAGLCIKNICLKKN